eukprot:s739_g29.t1
MEDVKKRINETDKKWIKKHPSLFPFPLFLDIENGQEVRARAPELNFWDWLPYAFSWYPATFSHLFVTEQGHPEIIPSPELCKNATGMQIHHHLEHGTSKNIYFWSLILWTLFSIAHDSLLLFGYPEKLTLSIGLLTYLFQICACTASFLWAASAVKVFVGVKEDFEEHDHQGHLADHGHDVHCYFRLGTRSMLLVLVVPILLWQATRTKLESLALSVAHGDYLYSAVYQVPFRIVRDTLPANPLDSLLTVNMHGDKDVGFAENPALSFRHFQWLCRFTRFLSLVWSLVQFLIIGPFTIGPLFRRLLMEVVQRDLDSFFRPSFRGALMYGTYFVAIVLPLILVVKGALELYTHVMLPMICEHLKKRWRALMFAFFLVSISVLASAFCSTVELIGAVHSWHDKTITKTPHDVLKAAWGWYLHGVLIFLLVVYETGNFVSWPLLLRSFSPMRYEFLLETAQLKPEWRLELHERLVKSSRQKLGVPVLNRKKVRREKIREGESQKREDQRGESQKREDAGARKGVGHLKRTCKDAFRVADAVQETYRADMLRGRQRQLVDEVREELKADDTETSHVPLAEKVIQSHGDLTESSSDEWWEGGDAQCMKA